MKQANWIVAATLVLFSGIACAQMIGSSKIVTQVPFEFVVANKVVPAGKWVVQAATENSNTLNIRNAQTNAGAFSNSSPTEGKESSPCYALVFEHYGDQYFLSGIKLEGSKTMYRLPVSKAEAELRAQNVPATEEVLVASLQ